MFNCFWLWITENKLGQLSWETLNEPVTQTRLLRCAPRRSRVWLFVTLWTAACQAPFSMGFPRKNMEWVAISSSRGTSPPRKWTHIACPGRWVLYLLSHLGSPIQTKHPVKLYNRISVKTAGAWSRHLSFVRFFSISWWNCLLWWVKSSILNPIHPLSYTCEQQPGTVISPTKNNRFLFRDSKW